MLLSIDDINMLSGIRIALRNRISNSVSMDYNSQDLGNSLEFEDYQQFTPGENTRHINWNRYMCDSSLVIRKYQMLQRPEFTVAIDLSSSVVASDKVQELKRFTAAICFCLLNRGVLVKLYSNSDLKKYQGKSGWQRMNYDIEMLESGHATMPQIDSFSPHLSKNIIVVSDFLFNSGIEEFKKHIVFNDCNYVFFNIFNEYDKDPSIRGDFKLVDSKNSKHLRCTVDEKMIGYYRQARKEYYTRIERYCLEMNWQYKDINVEGSLYEQIMSIAQSGALLL